MAPTFFPILLEVEADSVGKVLLLLKDQPGIKIHLDLDGVAKKGIRRDRRQKRNPDTPRAKDIVIAELMTGQKNLQHLRDKFREHELSANNVSTTLYELAEAGITESAGPRVHRLTERALSELQPNAPPPAESLQLPSPAPETKLKRGESRGFVLRGIAEGKTRFEMMKAGQLIGIGERMIDGALTRLKNEKLIVKNPVAPGAYSIAPAKTGKSK